MFGKRLAAATRFYESKAEKVPVSLARLNRWINAALEVASVTLVGVDLLRDRSNAVELLSKREDIIVVPVYSSGKFVLQLNALVYEAASRAADRILFASVGYPLTKAITEQLAAHMDTRTLVTGARMPEHDFFPQTRAFPADGNTIPWNTLALWNCHKLATTGFALVGDSPYEPGNAGVEELATAAVLQTICSADCKVVSVAGVPPRDTTGWNSDRRERHLQKMVSKRERPAAQLKKAGLSAPLVAHID